mmetsp:Transcript_18156/g.37914  ORF Transcript_18156/g.37914 Transcript_18156/m.37914 type:complete len:554 (+) Transcript_18156:531-2192(+)|eukprot:CAMPEP_0171330602 /NCGR_PEP_ID=MMETSP0878-20121228/2121_1 /TAXON_ID=67004 /ORGANISM="Thalassiosira weissflogii, Strain CCMP1336" /LENGTH=553 /DNA_ID=CAMNT_0011830943 /DNA_START=539 /DNA_END=2200 /DNA_ORIENTATION=+
MPEEVDFDVNVTNLYASIGRSDWESASRACVLHPIEAETWVIRKERDDDGEVLRSADGTARGNIMWRFLPLHSACARDPPSSFIRDLLRAYPDAAGIRDDQGMYPLHYACGNRASRGVIRQLLEAFPRATRLVDPNGMLPLHYLASWGQAERGIVEMLLEANPEGVLARDKDGATALDLAKEGNYEGWEEVVDVLEMAMDSPSGGSRRGRKYSDDVGLSVAVPDHSSLGSTMDVRSNKKSPRARTPSARRSRSTSRSRTHSRNPSPSPRPYHPEARSVDDMSSIPPSPVSRGGNSHHFAERESRTPRHSTRSSLEDMKTPRSSGRGGNGGFGFDTVPTPSGVSGTGSRSMSRSRSRMGVSPRDSQEPYDMAALEREEYRHQDQRELTKLIAEIRRDKEAAQLRADAAENRAERKEAENNELRIKFAEYENMVSNYREAVDKLQGVIKALALSQEHLGGIVETAERRENERMRKSEERRKALMELIRAEEEAERIESEEYRYDGDILGAAFVKQLRDMDNIRSEIEDMRIMRDASETQRSGMSHIFNSYRKGGC